MSHPIGRETLRVLAPGMAPFRIRVRFAGALRQMSMLGR